MPDQFEKGLDVIRNAVQEAMHGHGIDDAIIRLTSTRESKPGAALEVSANGIEAKETFSHSEIDDSGEAIDAPAAIKVRMLASKFVR